MPTLYPLARAALFSLPPERAHEVVMDTLAALPGPARQLLRAACAVDDPRLRSRLWGIDFPSPLGLAAGLDKAGTAFNSLAALGFGFVEIGTVTLHPQPGNPRPRLFRLSADQALLNRMGFNNPGAAAVARRLASGPIETTLGINIGKSKVTPLEEALDDYMGSIESLERFASYLVVNVSSPNTPGLRTLQEAGPLRRLLAAVIGRSGATGRQVPVLVKLSPDLSDSQLDQAVDIALEEGVAGIVAVNTTIARDVLAASRRDADSFGDGGISGRPLRTRAVQSVARIHARTGGAVPIIGVGGIFTAEDAWNRLRAGASLLQLYTGLIYEGPGIVKRINEGLLDRMGRAGVSSIGEVIGSAREND